MSHLFTNARWWRNGELCNLRVSDEGKVTYRGPDEPLADDETDLEGAWLMPAFVDCHCHILAAGLDLRKLDLTGCESRDEVLRRVRERANAAPDNEWVLAVQYDQTKFEDGAHITAKNLEPATLGRPCILRHTSGHACVVNETVLAMAEWRDAPGGEIVRDENGSPTGVLLENAMQIAYKLLPKPTREEMADAIFEACGRMNAFGITSAADMGSTWDFEDQVWAYREALARGAKMRIRLYPNWSQILRQKPEIPVPSELLRVAGVKLYADGAIGARTAAIHGEYVGGGSGQLIYSPEELQKRIAIADENGYSIAVHSIGDRSTDVVLDALEKTRQPSQHRIEHVMMASDSQIRRIAQLGIGVSMQPEFRKRFIHAYKRQLGDERAATLKRARAMLDAGIRLGFSSDLPIVPGNPWDGIAMAVEHPTEPISYENAVDCYTRGAALLDGDNSFGRLDITQYADLQIYDNDPRNDFGVKPRAAAFAGKLAAV